MCNIECKTSSKNEIFILSIFFKQKTLEKDTENAERFNKISCQKKYQRKGKHEGTRETDENPTPEKYLLSAKISGDDEDGKQVREGICKSNSKDKRFRPGKTTKLLQKADSQEVLHCKDGAPVELSPFYMV